MLAAFGSRRSPKAASTACTDPSGATPVFVVNCRQIISNRLSRTLITDVDPLSNRRRNIARFVLLDPGRPRPVENWAEVVRRQRHHGRGQGHCCHSAVDAGRASGPGPGGVSHGRCALTVSPRAVVRIVVRSARIRCAPAVDIPGPAPAQQVRIGAVLSGCAHGFAPRLRPGPGWFEWCAR
ncbi:hypothetical protein [Streptomyces mirabilis]|uniref:MmyB family transcriptional regulator n=1 Tax=Streptomyces mirabilis TaxID=68239 RepID=UPI003316735C